MLNKVFCFRLHTFGVVMGWLSIVASIFATIILSIVLAHGNERIDDFFFGTFKLAFVVCMSIILILAAISIVTSFLLLVALPKKKSSLVLPWLIDNGLRMFLVTILNLIVWIGLICNAPVKFIILYFIFIGALNVLGWYLYYGIYSLYRSFQALEDIKGSGHPFQRYS
ncbi:uncharacterized protein LOC108087775 [Drosophila ficusphila]|uniref:uncharacterized protein LOC108087775 n=1 Tax=Drosophila ficusphila TaxID=30025 RepID=UPI001C8A96B7|nr:uncharacterized protein LOC108087775 [Drosophila ficusphila]